MANIDNRSEVLISSTRITQRYNRGEVMANPTPASTFKKRDAAEAARYKRDITRARAEGHAEGRSEARAQAVTFLQNKYMGPNAPERGTPKAEAILELTRELVLFFEGKNS
jgi:hypothetical protein